MIGICEEDPVVCGITATGCMGAAFTNVGLGEMSQYEMSEAGRGWAGSGFSLLVLMEKRRSKERKLEEEVPRQRKVIGRGRRLSCEGPSSYQHGFVFVGSVA
jgi:hypothetical protein